MSAAAWFSAVPETSLGARVAYGAAVRSLADRCVAAGGPRDNPYAAFQSTGSRLYGVVANRWRCHRLSLGDAGGLLALSPCHSVRWRALADDGGGIDGDRGRCWVRIFGALAYRRLRNRATASLHADDHSVLLPRRYASRSRPRSACDLWLSVAAAISWFRMMPHRCGAQCNGRLVVMKRERRFHDPGRLPPPGTHHRS